jgi:AraC-like DNA-binding protein
MKPSLDLLLIVNFLGAAQALLLAFALLNIKRGNRIANRLLAAFAMTIAVCIGSIALSKTSYIELLPRLEKIHQPFTFLGAPLLFLYVRALLSTRPALGRKALLHFIPSVLCALYLIPYYLRSGADEGSISIAYYGVRWFTVRSALLIVQFLVYLILIAFMLVRRSRAAKERGPSERIMLFQIRFLLTTFLILWSVGVVHYMASLLVPAYYKTPETDLIIPLGLTALVYALAYLGFRKPEALTGVAEPTVKKYVQSNLTPERSDRYAEKLLRFMETEKPYTQSDLTLQQLAERLAIPTRHLSRVINERLNQNFADFVNSYRVEEAKRRLIDPAKKHYSILAVAEEVGFNSKSSFNSVFKKHANMTPSEFRKAAGEKSALTFESPLETSDR